MERGDQESSLQSPFIHNSEGGHEFDGETSEQQSICSKANVIEESKKQLWLAGPLIAVSLLQYCLQVISIMFVGHLGELALSSASIATSFASVTGFSVLGLWMGIICGLSVQIIALVTVNACTNWDHEAIKAMHGAQRTDILTNVAT